MHAIQDPALVPTRVGMILMQITDIVAQLACPHTRGDDPRNAESNK